MDALAHAIFMLAVMPIILILIYLPIMFLIVQFKGDTSIGNFTWGGGVMLVALYELILNFLPGYFNGNLRIILVTTLIILWALRLILYLYIRYSGKDPRFKNWKWQGLQAFFINIVWIFGQFFLIIIMILPIGSSIYPIEPLTYSNFIGLALWVFGFIFESISDYQLYSFLHNPKNKGHVMQYGLWHYSRHPNYFGEVCMWWGIYLISLPTYLYVEGVAKYMILAPITITVMLRFITGVPMLENAMKDNPEYQEYKRKTNVFVPWFAKK